MKFQELGVSRMTLFEANSCNKARQCYANQLRRAFLKYRNLRVHDWQQLTSDFGPKVWKTVYRILNDYQSALDCYQSVFLDAFKRNSGKPIDDWGSLLQWLATKRAIDHLRREKRKGGHLAISHELVANITSFDRPETPMATEELVELVRKELTQIPIKQAQAFWLFAIEELTYAEVASAMSIPSSEVGVLIHRCRSHLRNVLDRFLLFDSRSQI